MTRGNWATRVRGGSPPSADNENALEPLVVRYHPGEKYEPHHDLFDLCDLPQKPRRHLTFLIYLNTMDESAGAHTTFRGSRCRSRPRRGRRFFNDVLDNGHGDEDGARLRGAGGGRRTRSTAGSGEIPDRVVDAQGRGGPLRSAGGR